MGGRGGRSDPAVVTAELGFSALHRAARTDVVVVVVFVVVVFVDTVAERQRVAGLRARRRANAGRFAVAAVAPLHDRRRRRRRRRRPIRRRRLPAQQRRRRRSARPTESLHGSATGKRRRRRRRRIGSRRDCELSDFDEATKSSLRRITDNDDSAAALERRIVSLVFGLRFASIPCRRRVQRNGRRGGFLLRRVVEWPRRTSFCRRLSSSVSQLLCVFPQSQKLGAVLPAAFPRFVNERRPPAAFSTTVAVWRSRLRRPTVSIRGPSALGFYRVFVSLRRYWRASENAVA